MDNSKLGKAFVEVGPIHGQDHLLALADGSRQGEDLLHDVTAIAEQSTDLRDRVSDRQAAPLRQGQVDNRHVNETILFIGGMTRSGTTLIAELLTARDEIALMIEYDFKNFLQDLSSIFSYHRMLYEVASPKVSEVASPKLSPGDEEPVATLTTFPIRENAVARRRYPSPDKLPAIAIAVVRASLDKPHATIIGSKAPYFFVDHTERDLVGRFEVVKYIMMIRRPFGQINSSMNRGNRAKMGLDSWPIQQIEVAIQEYRFSLNVIISFALHTDRKCLIVKYEDLVMNVSATLSSVGRFLGLDGLDDSIGILRHESDQTVLTDTDLQLLQQAFGRLENSWLDLQTFDRITLANTLMLGLEPVKEAISVYNSKMVKDFLGAGWSFFKEDDGAWTSSEWADLIFVGEEEWIVLATFTPYMPLENSVLDVDIRWNGKPIARIVFTKAENIDESFDTAGTHVVKSAEMVKHTFSFGPLTLTRCVPNVLKFSFKGAASPVESGVSSDGRLLGLKLYALQFIPARPG